MVHFMESSDLMSKAISFVYITVGSEEEADLIGKSLVKEKLAACANIISPMRSFYWWNDEIQSDKEIVVIFKTQSSLIEVLISRVKELHSYECPCIIVLPVECGNKNFLNWIIGQTNNSMNNL